MTRSLESIAKRAEKRGNSLEAQKKLDWDSHAKKEKEEKTKVKESSSKAKAEDLSLKRERSRDTVIDVEINIEMAKKSRQASSFSASSPSSSAAQQSSMPKHVAQVKTKAVKTKADKAGPLTSWICSKCCNSNYPERVECFRCRTDKPSVRVSAHEPVKATAAPPARVTASASTQACVSNSAPAPASASKVVIPIVTLPNCNSNDNQERQAVLCFEIWELINNPKKCDNDDHAAMISYLDDAGWEGPEEMLVLSQDAEEVDKILLLMKKAWRKPIHAKFKELASIPDGGSSPSLVPLPSITGGAVTVHSPALTAGPISHETSNAAVTSTTIISNGASVAITRGTGGARDNIRWPSQATEQAIEENVRLRQLAQLSPEEKNENEEWKQLSEAQRDRGAMLVLRSARKEREKAYNNRNKQNAERRTALAGSAR